MDASVTKWDCLQVCSHEVNNGTLQSPMKSDVSHKICWNCATMLTEIEWIVAFSRTHKVIIFATNSSVADWLNAHSNSNRCNSRTSQRTDSTSSSHSGPVAFYSWLHPINNTNKQLICFEMYCTVFNSHPPLSKCKSDTNFDACQRPNARDVSNMFARFL